MNVTVYQSRNTGNWEKNLERAIASCRSSKGLIVAPELFLTGYDFSLAREAALFSQLAIDELGKVCRDAGNWFIGSFLISKGGKHFNRQILLNSSATYDKVHLIEPLQETKYITAGSSLTSIKFEESNVKAGLAICYDLRFPELFRRLALDDVSLFFVSAQWPTSRMEHFLTLLRARAIENQAFVIAANATGETAKTLMGGHSSVISPTGEVLYEADADEALKITEIDLDLVTQWRQEFPAIKDFISREKGGSLLRLLQRYSVPSL